MNETNTTYAHLKHLPSKKPKQKEKIKEAIIYSEVKTSTSNSNQTKVTKNKSSKGKASSVPFTWCLTVVILGIFCFFLLLTTGILGFMVFQGHHECQPRELPLDNVTQQDNPVLKNVTFKEEPLNTGSKSSTCEMKRVCSRQKCYYFSCELKNYEDSKKFCKEKDSTLLKIEDEKELKFIQSHLYSVSHYSWIGLSQKGTSHSWTWEDGSGPTIPSLFFLQNNGQQTRIGNCARIAARKIDVSECSKPSHYVCEKKNAHLVN